MNDLKNILVLSGGGFKGAFQIGALETLSANWQKITGLNTPMHFDKISGVSVGALNGALIAMGEEGFKQLIHLWYDLVGVNGVSEIYTSTIIEVIEKDDEAKLKFKPTGIVKQLVSEFQVPFSFFKDLPLVFSKNRRVEFLHKLQKRILEEVAKNFQNFKGIADNTPLFDKLKKYLHRDKLVSEYRCGFVSLDTGEYHSVLAHEFETNEDFVKGVLASTVMPIIWTPVDKVVFRRNGKRIIARNCVDGGVKNVTPLGDVIQDMKPDENYRIFIINCHDGKVLENGFSDKNIGQIALRALQEIAMGEIFNNDLSEFIKINDLVKQNQENGAPDLYDFSWSERKRTDRVLKAFEYVIIEPDTDVLGNPLVSTTRIFQKRIEHGKNKAAGALK